MQKEIKNKLGDKESNTIQRLFGCKGPKREWIFENDELNCRLKKWKLMTTTTTKKMQLRGVKKTDLITTIDFALFQTELCSMFCCVEAHKSRRGNKNGRDEFLKLLANIIESSVLFLIFFLKKKERKKEKTKEKEKKKRLFVLRLER